MLSSHLSVLQLHASQTQTAVHLSSILCVMCGPVGNVKDSSRRILGDQNGNLPHILRIFVAVLSRRTDLASETTLRRMATLVQQMRAALPPQACFSIFSTVCFSKLQHIVCYFWRNFVLGLFRLLRAAAVSAGVRRHCDADAFQATSVVAKRAGRVVNTKLVVWCGPVDPLVIPGFLSEFCRIWFSERCTVCTIAKCGLSAPALMNVVNRSACGLWHACHET